MVDFCIVGLTEDKLWSDIVDRATERRSPLIDSVSGPPEITKLHRHLIQIIY